MRPRWTRLAAHPLAKTQVLVSCGLGTIESTCTLENAITTARSPFLRRVRAIQARRGFIVSSGMWRASKIATQDRLEVFPPTFPATMAGQGQKSVQERRSGCQQRTSKRSTPGICDTARASHRPSNASKIGSHLRCDGEWPTLC
jgi:hypothetical protein